MTTEITWRPYEERDREDVYRLKHEQDTVLGKKMDFNELSEHPVLLAEVAETDEGIIGVHTLESVPEYCMISRDPRFTAAAQRRAPEICGMLKHHGFRIIRCVVPEWMGRDTQTIENALRSAGFRSAAGYKHLLLDLR